MKKSIQILLIIAVCIIWGLIILRMVDFFTRDVETATGHPVSGEIDSLKIPLRTETSSDGVLPKRNPYTYDISSPVAIEQEESYPIPVPLPQNIYKVSGLIINGNSKLVILEDTKTLKTFFLRVGEKQDNIKVLKIEEKEVLLLKGTERKLISPGQTIK